MKVECGRDGCSNDASRYPQILMNAAGEGFDALRALRLVVPIGICLDHQPEFDVQDFLLPESRRRLRVELMKQGKAMPDFDGAWVEWHHVGDALWREFHRKRGASE